MRPLRCETPSARWTCCALPWRAAARDRLDTCCWALQASGLGRRLGRGSPASRRRRLGGAFSLRSS